MSGEAETLGSRRLPLWMSSSTTTSISTTNNQITAKKESSNSSSSSISRVPAVTKAKAGTRETTKKSSCTQLDDETEGEEEQEQDFRLPAKKKRTKKPVEMLQTKSKTLCRKTTGDPSLASQDEDNDDELTVDDLLDIAQEYVKANNDNNDGEQRILASPENTSDKADTTSSSKSPDDDDEQIERRVTGTGDATQDMLDLFLGPLLRKPTNFQHENKWEAAFYNNNNIEENDQSQKEEESEKQMVQTKKKSSLRDKVAMLLDY